MRGLVEADDDGEVDVGADGRQLVLVRSAQLDVVPPRRRHDRHVRCRADLGLPPRTAPLPVTTPARRALHAVSSRT